MAGAFQLLRSNDLLWSRSVREYLLDNDLAQGRYEVDGRPVAISDIRVPVFAVATETDHVSPWRSVYKLHPLVDSDITFLLTSGGHNAGIVSPPGHRITTHVEGKPYEDPEAWLRSTPAQAGSW